jgi:hypothetical protein
VDIFNPLNKIQLYFYFAQIIGYIPPNIYKNHNNHSLSDMIFNTLTFKNLFVRSFLHLYLRQIFFGLRTKVCVSLVMYDPFGIV